jgi:surfeit locus 1 family protein
MAAPMTRRVPILPTLFVAAAVAVMVWLGFWQLHRLGEKEAALARYQRSLTMSSEAPWPKTAAEREMALYRHSALTCAKVTGIDQRAGHSQSGETGWAHIAHCALVDGQAADVALGWSSDPRPVNWHGGEVTGFVGPSGKHGVRLVAAPPQAGLTQLAAPDPRDVPNNHLSYAVQWFLFAVTALVIYGLALRKRWREQD